jgi:hypothetical protein
MRLSIHFSRIGTFLDEGRCRDTEVSEDDEPIRNFSENAIAIWSPRKNFRDSQNRFS